MMLPAPVSVDVGVLALAVSTEDIGALHPVLAPTATWRPQPERDELDALARAERARLGWLDRQGQSDAEVTAALAVLCRPDVEFFGWIHDGERTIGVLAAAIGRLALLAVRDDNTARLSHVRSTELPEKLVG